MSAVDDRLASASASANAGAEAPADFVLDAEGGSASWRRAALLLHSMTGVDRDWMLSRLPVAHRRRLQSLLDELKRLGFEADPSLVREAIAASRSAPTPPAMNASGAPSGAPTQAASAAHEQLRRWRADTAIDQLADEPDRLVAIVLAAGPWTWAASLERHLGVERMRRIDAWRDAPTPVALREAVLSAASARSVR